MARGPTVQLGVGGPALGGQESARDTAEGISQGDEPKDREPRDHVGHTGYGDRSPEQLGGKPANPAPDAGRFALELALSNHDVGPALASTPQVGDELGAVGKIG